MSVLIETTLGDLVVDLFVKERPNACRNFLKLCKVKYYNLNQIFTIEVGHNNNTIVLLVHSLSPHFSLDQLHRSDWGSDEYWPRRRVHLWVRPNYIHVPFTPILFRLLYGSQA